jgi:hypothetical protein
VAIFPRPRPISTRANACYTSSCRVFFAAVGKPNNAAFKRSGPAPVLTQLTSQQRFPCNAGTRSDSASTLNQGHVVNRAIVQSTMIAVVVATSDHVHDWISLCVAPTAMPATK